MKSTIEKPESINKAESNFWPYLIKFNQFKKIIKDKNNFIRLGLTSSSTILFEYYANEEPYYSLYKSTFNIMKFYDLDDYFKSMKNIDEIYVNIMEVLNKGEFNIESLNYDFIILILICDKKEIKINLNKQNCSIMDKNRCELNEFINQLYTGVLTLKNALNISA